MYSLEALVLVFIGAGVLMAVLAGVMAILLDQ